MADLRVRIGKMELKNPVIAASGTYGFGKEYGEYIDLGRLGGISVKAVTLEQRRGNPPPRIAETPSGILNSVGLQNPGIRAFKKEWLPYLDTLDTAIIVNIAGNTVNDYVDLAKELNDTQIDAIEVNVSCPNVKEGCALFGATPTGVYSVASAVRSATAKPIIVKLTPNRADIAETAKAAEEGGADAVSLINTILGLAIDIETRRPILGSNFGGLSGPAVKPVALRMVYEAAKSVRIPVIGMGGIMNGSDAIEFMLAGATAIMVGTANFLEPEACIHIADGIGKYLDKHYIEDVTGIIGKLVLN